MPTEEEAKTTTDTRNELLENVLGNLMVAQYHSMMIRSKIDKHFPNDESFMQSQRYVKLIDHYSQWYKVTVKIEKVAVEDIDPTSQDNDYKSGLENMLGQMLVADYQVFELKKKVVVQASANPSSLSASSFTWKLGSTWYKSDIHFCADPDSSSSSSITSKV